MGRFDLDLGDIPTLFLKSLRVDPVPFKKRLGLVSNLGNTTRHGLVVENLIHGHFLYLLLDLFDLDLLSADCRCVGANRVGLLP